MNCCPIKTLLIKPYRPNSMNLNNYCNLENYRSNGFAKYLVGAKDLAELAGTEPIFIQKRICRINRQHDSDDVDAKYHLKINVFNILVDQIKASLVECFKHPMIF